MKQIIILITICIFLANQLIAQTKPSIYGTWYISKQVEVDKKFVDANPEKLIAVLSRKLDFKANNIKRREVLIINTNNKIVGGKEEADKNNKPVVEKVFKVGGVYNPKSNTIYIYPNGKKENKVTCKVLKITASKLYLDMVKKPSDYYEPEPLSEQQDIKIADSIVAEAAKAVEEAATIVDYPAPVAAENKYENPDAEIETYFPQIISLNTHPLFLLKAYKYNQFATYIDEQKGITIYHSEIETETKNFSKNAFIEAINKNQVIDWGINTADKSIKKTMAQMLNNIAEIDTNYFKTMAQVMPAQKLTFGNLAIDFKEKYPNAMLIIYHQPASSDEELNWKHNVLVIDRSSKKIVGIYFIGWTI